MRGQCRFALTDRTDQVRLTRQFGRSVRDMWTKNALRECVLEECARMHMVQTVQGGTCGSYRTGTVCVAGLD